MKTCQKCGFNNEENAKFCRNCGQEIVDSSRNQSCKKCGKPIIPGTRFCKYCGSMVEVGKESVPEVKKVEKVEQKKVSSKSNFGILAIVAIVIVVLIAVCVAISQKPSGDDYNSDNQNYVECNDQDVISGELPVDIYEPNDSRDSATIVQVGDTYKGVLSSVDDKDYFCVEANGHDSLSYTFTHNSSNSIDGIGWEISYHTNDSTSSTMAWLDEKELIGECSDIDISNGYFIVWIENTRNDPETEEVMEFVSRTEYSITFNYNDYESQDYILEDSESRDYILEGSDSKYLTKADLAGLTAEECRLARNEIYARHGRIFKDEAIREYFESFDWYYPRIQPDDFEESMLNDYEIANRDLIVEYESEQGYR